MMEIIRGRVWKFGDKIDTDVIYPGRYLKITEPEETKQHCFEIAYPDFREKVKPGDIIVAGRFFGCGSSREQAAICIKYLGIGAVIAESFARIFYRNAINIGLPIVISPGITERVKEGDIIEVDMRKGIIKNETTQEEIPFSPLPEFMMEILKSGGLIPYLRKKLKNT